MKIYLVGGAVRDQLLDFPCKEKDWVVIGSTSEEMLEKGFKPVGKDFPVFLHPETHEEYALARTERKTGRGYTEFSFHASPDVTLEEDLQRRDLTINAMAQDEQGNIIDPNHGREDLKNKILRHVSEAFIEDPVRILRVARFSARFHHLRFKIADETLSLMQKMVNNGEVDALVPERVWQEWQRSLEENNPIEFLNVLNQCGALEKLLPEFLGIPTSHTMCAPRNDNQGHCEATKWPWQSQVRLPRRYAPRNDGKIVFANMLLALTEQEIKAVCSRYKIPSEYKELALLAKQQQKNIEKNNFSAEQLIKLFDETDAWRREERFKQLLIIFLAEEQQNKLLSLLEKAKNISAQKLIDQGLQGPALGQALHQARLNTIKDALRAN